MSPLRVASLFSGIGGIDLALEALGAEVVAQVDIEPFAQQVLRSRWPSMQVLGDIKEVHSADLAGADTLAGGFPCQPVSLAGRKLAQDDPRWLWPHIARLIDEVGPRYVLLENVPGLLGRHGGMGDVLGGLAERGYDAAWGVLAAADVGAWHLRRRVWIAATNAVGPERVRVAVPEALVARVDRWPTPRASQAMSGPLRDPAAILAGPRGATNLEDAIAVRMSVPTPSASEADGGPQDPAQRRAGGHHVRLRDVVSYPTPAARDHKDSGPNVNWSKLAAKSKLAGVVMQQELLPTPNASDNRNRGGPETPAIQRRLEAGRQINLGMTVQGTLNPDWVEWLMGYGVGWTDPEREPEPFAGWHAEPEGVPRVAVEPHLRRQRLTALGNAVVPQAAAVGFGRLINLLADMEEGKLL